MAKQKNLIDENEKLYNDFFYNKVELEDAKAKLSECEKRLKK